jgi:micrococcal nuclease
LWLSGIGKVRMIGIDTPEVFGERECFGRQASAFVERIAPLDTRVRYRLGVEERDRYGRALAYVWLRDGRFLNRLVVAGGYAQPLTIPPNVEYEDVFVRAARRARAAGRGLWGRPGCAASSQPR